MKSKKVDTVASDEENVRLRIYDGVIPLDEAGHELVALARSEARRDVLALRLIVAQHETQIAALEAVVEELKDRKGWLARLWERVRA